MNFHGITKIFVTLQIIMLKTTHNRKEKKNNQKNKMQSNYLNILKKYAADIVVVILFALVSVAYFMPAVSEGRILYRHDASAGRGAGQEISMFKEQTGEQSRWTNALFSGMPTYQSAPAYDSAQTLSEISKFYHLWLPDYVWYLFAYLLGFYIMLRAFDFRWHLAALGSVMWAFSSYFLIIIAAGHLWKVMALAYLPPMIGGILLAYRGKYGAGFVVTALFAAMEVLANHVQMTYYYMFIIICMVVGFLYTSIREKELGRFLKASGVCLAAAAVGIMLNASNLYHTWEYQKESMRGKSELVKENTANQTSSGLDRDYITQWSYGIDETWTLLVPNTKGGSSMTAIADSKVGMEHAINDYYGIYQQMGQYWGEQPGTSGPVYVGAFVLTLFFLGLFIVKGPMKWALLVATILSILLSWGKNFMPMTDFFLDYIPMYAKFRTVASILVIAEFTIPLLAIMALKEISDNPDILKKNKKAGAVSLAMTAGVCFLFAVMPTVFFPDFISGAEYRMLSQFPQEQLTPLLTNLREVREAIFVADCWRSFWIIMIGSVIVMAFVMRKLRVEYMVGMLTVLCLVDMWQVDKRYLNDEMFVNADVRDLPQPMTETDKEILKDTSLDYRVLNLASNTFNENETSYYHKSIGGYHPAKLRRYQELIEEYIHPEMQATMSAIVEAQGDMTLLSDSISPVLNMLNTKYFIIPLQENRTMPLQNLNAFGNAWFVSDVKYVQNANEELEAMRGVDLKTTAVADRKFSDALGKTEQQDSTSKVTITEYAPNHLKYKASSKKGGVIVFSEIYYPGWTALVDGTPVEMGRVNYVLRAINVPGGTHEILLDFHPQSLFITELLANIGYVILVIVVLGIAFARKLKMRRKAKQEKEDEEE